MTIGTAHLMLNLIKVKKGGAMQTVEGRRALKESLPRTELDLVHTSGCTVLPNRLIMLDYMPKSANVAEIGVAYGAFSVEIIQRCDPNCLYLIDAWANERFSDGMMAVKERHAADVQSQKVIVRQGMAMDMLKTFQKGILDWVYIDTNHQYDATLNELILCDAILGDNGKIAGHDFCTGNVIKPVPYGVIEAVTQFCKDYDWRFEFLTLESAGHFSYCLTRIAADHC